MIYIACRRCRPLEESIRHDSLGFLQKLLDFDAKFIITTTTTTTTTNYDYVNP